MKIWVLFILPLLCAGAEFGSVYEKAALNSPLLRAKYEKILASQEALRGEAAYKNPVVSIGANDLLLNKDFLQRDKEPMQTHFISISQEFETFGKLELKEAMLRVDTLVLEYELEDLKVELYKKLALLVEKIESLSEVSKLLKQKKRNLEMLAEYYDTSISVEDALRKSVELQKKIFLVEDKLLEAGENIQRAKEEFFYLSNEEYVSAQKAQIQSDFTTEGIKSTPKYKILELRSKKLDIDAKLQERKKYSNVNLSLGYNHRQDFSDYLSVSASFVLPVYGTEDAKAKSAMYLKQESVQNTKDYTQKALMLFQNAAKKVEYLGKRVRNIDDIIFRYTDLRSYEDTNIKSGVVLERNIENENLLIDLRMERLKYELEIQSARWELFYLTKEGV